MKDSISKASRFLRIVVIVHAEKPTPLVDDVPQDPTMSSYETFTPVSPSEIADHANLIYEEPASQEAETWMKLFHSVPQGVLKRKHQEEQEGE